MNCNAQPVSAPLVDAARTPALARHPRDEAQREPAAQTSADAPLQSPVGDPLLGSLALRSRVQELEVANASLRRAAAAGMAQARALRRRLALAEERIAQQERAGALQAFGATCAGALHREQPCGQCDGSAPPRHLSAREREVLRLLSEGSRSPCIADSLGIKLATVEVHRRNIMRKLGLHSVAALTRYALREGLISL